MSPPSNAPSAAAVAAECAHKYMTRVGEALPDDVAANLEHMSQWFRQQQRFADLFIQTLVPWERFNRPANVGHEAVADFLACGVVQSGITTNYDCLIEAAAQRLGEPDFLSIVDVEGLSHSSEHRPLLKVHGCSASIKSRLTTVWCKEQLDEPDFRDRMNRFRIWLQHHLLDSDVLIVGFWSDWAYLSELFADTIDATGPRSVFLVDPSPPNALQEKAPTMWNWAHRPGITFLHEQTSGAVFLDDLRSHFSRVWLRRVLLDAADTYQQLFRSPPPSPIDSSLEAGGSGLLYALRRDLSGVPQDRPVRSREAKPEYRVHAALHIRLQSMGTTYQGHIYLLNGEAVRIIQGKGQLLSQVRQQYENEPPLPVPSVRTVCLAVTIDGAAANIVRPDEHPGIVRSGVAGSWISEDDFLKQLGATHA